MPAFKTIGAAGESSLGNAEKEAPGYRVLVRQGLIPVATNQPWEWSCFR